MSLVTNIKEFADILNTIYSNQLTSIEPAQLASSSSEALTSLELSKSFVLQQALIHFVKNIGSGIFYFLSFQWFREFSYLPLLTPSILSTSVFSDTFASNPVSHLFSLSKTLEFVLPQGGIQKTDGILHQITNQLGAGFINSCFLSLPFSLPQLVTLRRLFSQGTAAAGASILGTVAAHSLFLIGVIYGLRFLIIPYLSLQPLTFVIGLVTVVVVINELVQEKKMYLVALKHTPSLVTIFLLNFLLALSEEPTIFHPFSNLTLNTGNTFLEFSFDALLSPFAKGDVMATYNSFLFNTIYLSAFIVGHCAFSFAFCFGILKAVEQLCSLTGWTLSRVARKINQIVLLFIVAFTFSSFPYYGLDYLFTKIGGFLPEDPFLSNTLFSPTMVKSRNTYFKSNAPAKNDEVTPLELDLNYFDRGVYLNASKEENKSSQSFETGVHLDSLSGAQSNQVLVDDGTVGASQNHQQHYPTLTFEELNYQGEYAWLMRHERARSIPEEQSNVSDDQGGSQQTVVNSFSSFFQQPKTHFKELRLKQENNQAAAALKERSPRGFISKWKEGTLPGESTPFEALTLIHKNSKKNALPRRGIKTANTENRSSFGDLSKSSYDDLSTPLITGDLSAPLINGKAKYNQSSSVTANKQGGHAYADVGSDLLNKELTFEEEIATNYTKGFVSPFSEEAESTTPLELLPIENIIKKRYLLNPVYRSLLRTDIDTFLARQPVQYKIAQNQEYSLFKKRMLLEKYYNWLRYYAPLDSTLHTDSVFMVNGVSPSQLTLPKSFVDTVYHHQFKGTLNTAKRLFKVTFDSDQNPTKNRVLSYDVPLYNFKSFGGTPNPSLHEELSVDTRKPDDRKLLVKTGDAKTETDKQLSVDTQSPLRKTTDAQSDALQPYGVSEPRKGRDSFVPRRGGGADGHGRVDSPFIEESSSFPVYAGWDNETRSFVITNRFNVPLYKH